MKRRFCSSVSGRRKARSSETPAELAELRSPVARVFPHVGQFAQVGHYVPGRLDGGSWRPWSQALETVAPRSQPRLRSSGRKGRPDHQRFGATIPAKGHPGIGPATPNGGVHCSEIDAVCSLASFDLKKSSRSG